MTVMQQQLRYQYFTSREDLMTKNFYAQPVYDVSEDQSGHTVMDQYTRNGFAGYVISMLDVLARLDSDSLVESIRQVATRVGELMDADDGRLNTANRHLQQYSLAAKVDRHLWVGILYLSAIIPHVDFQSAKTLFEFLIQRKFLRHALTFDCLVMIIQASAARKARAVELEIRDEDIASPGLLFDFIFPRGGGSANWPADRDDKYIFCCAAHKALLTPGLSDLCDRPTNPAVISTVVAAIHDTLAHTDFAAGSALAKDSKDLTRYACVWRSIAFSAAEPLYVRSCAGLDAALPVDRSPESVRSRWARMREAMKSLF